MSRSLIYAVNEATQSVADGDNINFGAAVRRYGCALKANGGNIDIADAGYYAIDTSITFDAPLGATGTAKITLLKDGVEIPGATDTKTLTALATYTLSIPAVVREYCCGNSTITAKVTGAAITVTNATIRVIKE